MTKEELKQEAQEYYEDETEGTFQICEDCYWFADAVQTAYVDSAELREKRIAELEQKLEQTEKDLADYQFNYPTIKELQKEIVELKDDNGKLNRKAELLKKELFEGFQDKCYSKDKEQLTKAKEIIKSFITLLTKSRTALDTKTCLTKAEQFLNEVEK